MDLGGATSVPVASFARIPHDAVPAIRDAVRDPMLTAPDSPFDVGAWCADGGSVAAVAHLAASTARRSAGYCPASSPMPGPPPGSAEGPDRRTANAVLAEVYALVQHEIVWASEAELTWTVADRAMIAAQEADTPVALAGAAWTLGMVQRSVGDVNGALSLARDAIALLEPLMDDMDRGRARPSWGA